MHLYYSPARNPWLYDKLENTPTSGAEAQKDNIDKNCEVKLSIDNKQIETLKNKAEIQKEQRNWQALDNLSQRLAQHLENKDNAEIPKNLQEKMASGIRLGDIKEDHRDDDYQTFAQYLMKNE
ncbi:MAG TPA: hypothetical protein PLQ36_00230 [Candidatus Gracilibacteria bacterium]|nr:hypothetical protein [Candidatus Gracilibacteria bacterium]